MRTRLIVSLFFVLLFSTSSLAQNEVLREINSLYGIKSFGVVVNVEKSGSMDEIEFDIKALRRALSKELQELPIQILSDNQMGLSDQNPLLMLHINIMDAGNGLYPYASDLTFYQPVKLSLNQDLGSMAITWQTSFVGIVSGDMMKEIPYSSIELADDFIRDFNKVNL